jgi:hypothetical protein
MNKLTVYSVFLLFILCATFFVTKLSLAQDVKPKSTNNGTYQKDTTMRGTTYKIYVGRSGGRYIIRTSKAGNEYKQYLKKN